MNIIQKVELLMHQVKEAGLTILHIGSSQPDIKKHNTLQVRNDGKMYLIDRCGELQQLGTAIDGIPGGPGGGGGTSVAPIEVQIGSAAANTLGFLDGNTTLTNANFENHYLEIFIGNVNLYSIDKGDGSPWFFKTLVGTVVTLHNVALSTTDMVKIKFL